LFFLCFLNPAMKCRQCKLYKSEKEFYKHGDVFLFRCKSCCREYYWNFRKFGLKKGRQKMSDECRKERIRAKFKRWYANNKEYFPNRRRNNPEARLAIYARTRVCNAIKRFFKKGSKSAPTAIMLGCSIRELKEYLEGLFRPGMTWENYGPVWHVDHIKPCCQFDLTNPEEQYKCFNHKNLQPLFKEENLRKNKYAH
jgi:hypothetical protein